MYLAQAMASSGRKRQRRQIELDGINASYFACGACDYITTNDYSIAVINDMTESCPICNAAARIGTYNLLRSTND